MLTGRSRKKMWMPGLLATSDGEKAFLDTHVVVDIGARGGFEAMR